MKIYLQKAINLFVLMFCAIVGVGFISGAEIYSFFVRFGDFCYLGIFIFFVLNFLLCFKILGNFANTKKNVKLIKNPKNKENNTLYIIKRIIVFINVLLLSSAMIAGLKIMIKDLLINNYLICFLFSLIFVFIVLFLGIKGLAKLDYFVFAFVLVLTGLICYFFKTNNLQVITNENLANNSFIDIFRPWGLSFLFSILYVFMNIVQIEPLYRESGIKFTKNQAAAFSLCFSIFLSLLLLIYVQFLKGHDYLYNESMPFLTFFSVQSSAFHYLYVIGLFLGIISTLLSCLIGVKSGINKLLDTKVSCFAYCKFKKNNSLALIKTDSECANKNKNCNIRQSKSNNVIKNLIATSLSLGVAIILSLLGFNVFVQIIYPIIGALNFIVFVLL